MPNNTSHKSTKSNFPPSNWVETTLGEVIEISSGKSRPKDKGVFPVYGGNGILDYADNFNFENETIIIGRVGAYCGCVYFEKERFWLSDNALGIKSNQKSDIKFLYYFLINQNLNKKAIGGAQPLLTQGILNHIEVTIPPLAEQQSIASVLSAFDDKIELLREQNNTLEELGQTIFKEWFGKYRVDDELPNGWRVGKLGEVIDCIIDNRGKTPPITENSNDSIPLIEVNAIVGNNRIVDVNQCKKFVDQETYNSWFRKGHPQNGDILISTVGSVGQLAQVFDEKISIAQNIVALRFSNYGNFLYELLKSIQNEIISIDISSVQPSIKVPHLLNIEIIIPTKEIIEEFEKTISPITKKISDNNSQIQSLARSRDELLPKLMRGEVRVGF